MELHYEEQPSKIAFKFNLRRYTMGAAPRLRPPRPPPASHLEPLLPFNGAQALARDLHVLAAGGRFAHEVFPVGVPGGRRHAGAPAGGVCRSHRAGGAAGFRGMALHCPDEADAACLLHHLAAPPVSASGVRPPHPHIG